MLSYQVMSPTQQAIELQEQKESSVAWPPPENNKQFSKYPKELNCLFNRLFFLNYSRVEPEQMAGAFSSQSLPKRSDRMTTEPLPWEAKAIEIENKVYHQMIFNFAMVCLAGQRVAG